MAHRRQWLAGGRYIDIAGSGLLVGEAERQGKIVVATELGGGGHVTAEVHRIACEGLTNVLRHLGLLKGESEQQTTSRQGVILRAIRAMTPTGVGDCVAVVAHEIDRRSLEEEEL